MSDINDINPNRAPWTSSTGGTARDETGSAPYAPDQSSGGNAGPKKRGLGCWVWGCLGTIVFMLLALIGIGFGTYYLVTNQVAKYTDTQPAEMPVVEMEAEELAALEQRIDSFTSQVRGEKPAEAVDDPGVEAENPGDGKIDATDDQETRPPARELVLTAAEINGLIASKSEFRGRVFVEIQDGAVSGKVSIPTDGVPGGAGRYFNADAEFDVSMQEGILVVRLTDASVKGERIPQQLLDGMSRENLAKDVYSDPENAEMLRKFESIEVVGDSIVLRLKETELGPATPSSDEASPEPSNPQNSESSITPDTEPASAPISAPEATPITQPVPE